MRMLSLLALLLIGAATPSLARTPLAVADAPDLYQRVLTLPGARLAPAAGGTPAAAAVLPTFSVLYVFARSKSGNTDWVAVGAKSSGEPEGWLPATDTQDWHSMLVMQYAPRGQRDRVAFFADRAQLEALLDADDSSARGAAIAKALAAGKPAPTVVAAEPEGAVNDAAQFYVMPVLGAQVKQLADGTNVRMIEIASASAQPRAAPTPAQTAPGQTAPGQTTTPAPPSSPPVPPFRIGVVFVLDTTSSMQPYLDAVRATLANVSARLTREGTAGRVSFGLVGYRSNISRDPRLEYVTRIFAPLDPRVPPEQTLSRLDAMKASPYSTPAWDEDAFAGLHSALRDMDWSPFAARLLVLATDAGALPGNSPLVQLHNYDIENVVADANALHVAAFPLHLLTPEGDTHGDRSVALRQWRRLGQTGDASVNKYLGIRTGSVANFQKALDAFAGQLASSVASLAADHPVERPALSQQQEQVQVQAPPAEPEQQVTAALTNELFRAQAEYLGTRTGATAPPLLRAWASDHDLANPRLRALNVQVFLTRSQLNALAQSLKAIVDAARQASIAPQDFFQNLQLLSARTAADPERPAGTGEVTTLGMSNLLPAFLRVLPYHTRLQDMTSSEWLSQGVTGQQEFIDELDYKLQQYQGIYADPKRWRALDPRDPGNAVAPVPLDVLP